MAANTYAFNMETTINTDTIILLCVGVLVAGTLLIAIGRLSK